MIHQPVSVVSQRLAGGLACRDQRRLTGSGSTLEVLRDDALYKSMHQYFTFLEQHANRCTD